MPIIVGSGLAGGGGGLAAGTQAQHILYDHEHWMVIMVISLNVRWQYPLQEDRKSWTISKAAGTVVPIANGDRG